MSTPTDPRRVHPSTYIVQDRSNEEELIRLKIQDQMVTAMMGGVLPEQPDPAIFQRVLDVGCATGGWLIEVARAYPSISLLVGIDVSERMVKYAQAQAESQQVNDRVEFHTMDALRMLEFPSNYFDLVNLRFGQGYLRTWDWPKILHEFRRVARLDGVIRLTEGDIITENTSPALTQLNQLLLQAFRQAGHLFTPDSIGLTSELAPLLRQHGLHNVQTRSYTQESRAGTVEGQFFYEDMSRLFQTLAPFLRKWTRVPENYKMLYQQALDEMQQPDFVAKNGRLLTAWGYK
jgi:ubiquinone/menaquinone biosynthesis C-methylase UbiE